MEICLLGLTLLSLLHSSISIRDPPMYYMPSSGTNRPLINITDRSDNSTKGHNHRQSMLPTKGEQAFVNEAMSTTITPLPLHWEAHEVPTASTTSGPKDAVSDPRAESKRSELLPTSQSYLMDNPTMSPVITLSGMSMELDSSPTPTSNSSPMPQYPWLSVPNDHQAIPPENPTMPQNDPDSPMPKEMSPMAQAKLPMPQDNLPVLPSNSPKPIHNSPTSPVNSLKPPKESILTPVSRLDIPAPSKVKPSLSKFWKSESDGLPENVVVPSCPRDVTVCRLTFKLEVNITMMHWFNAIDTGEPDMMLPVIIGEDGEFYSAKRSCSGQYEVSREELGTLLSVDGSYKRTFTVNGRLPGTPIVLHRGQTVSITVTNNIESEVVLLHWHGLKMRDTPWMDGAGRVSHCAITPRQTFEYRFTPDLVGTHWYHGHIGYQRTMGLMGHLTVLDTNPEDENKRRGEDPVPAMSGEFHMMVNEWSNMATDELASSIEAGPRFNGGFNPSSSCDLPTKMDDGSFAWLARYDAILINGKGHRYDKRTGESLTPHLPLERFHVKYGGRFRFRLVNSGMHMSFSISVDDHMIHVIASDGQDIRTTEVDQLVIHSGETYDFWIDASDPTLSGNYWIRVTTLEHSNTQLPGQSRAILHYDTAPQDQPTTQSKDCHRLGCVALNCPYKQHSLGTNIKCIPITDLRRPVPTPVLTPDGGAGFTELMMALDVGIYASINGRRHIPHSVPPQIYPPPSTWRDAICSEELCDEVMGACHCTHEISIQKDHVVQMTFFSHIQPGAPAGSTHPIHLHGTKFEVLKIGWPQHNETTGFVLNNTQDILCDNPGLLCKRPRWRESSWSEGRVPGLTKQGAVVKDTVIVPVGGYTVLRFVANNPGYWLLHCHMDLHQEAGMALVLKVGEVKDMAPTPPGFPTCGDFDWSEEDFNESITNVHPQRDDHLLKSTEDTGDEGCSASAAAAAGGAFRSEALDFLDDRYGTVTAILTLYICVVLVLMLLIFLKDCVVCNTLLCDYCFRRSKRTNKERRSLSSSRRSRYRRGLMVETPPNTVPSSFNEETPLLS